MSKHTQEEWTVSDNKWWKTNPYSVVVKKKGVNGTAVANLPARALISNEERAANARLIAAAPKLLVALIDLVNSSERNYDNRHEYDAALDLIELINHSTGEQHAR